MPSPGPAVPNDPVVYGLAVATLIFFAAVVVAYVF